MAPEARDAAYAADITYGTNLSSASTTCATTWPSPRRTVQRGHYYAIVDEVDSILIDEARTPDHLGEPEVAPQVYYDFARVVRQMDGIPYKAPSKLDREARTTLTPTTRSTRSSRPS